MVGRSPVVASQEQREALAQLASSRDRAEADRARAILLTLDGWTSPRIGAAFGVREDVVRDWRSTFMREGIEGLLSRAPTGRPPVKAQVALAVAGRTFIRSRCRPAKLDAAAAFL
ncbi:helix-turn-helix domain-containing protein [Methylocystis sp.]|uniref:helix-turn-helix domain-containing protein n=1 Tax=Methylocystis sp. TaxID=1911079 RepID=UPI003DA2779C